MIHLIRQLFGLVNANILGQAAQQADRRQRPRLADEDTDTVTRTEEAREKSGDLLNLLRAGGGLLERYRLRRTIRRKVKQNLIAPFAEVDDLVDEVTERLVAAAESDPTYKRLLG